jgi:hypothetical protein
MIHVGRSSGPTSNSMADTNRDIANAPTIRTPFRTHRQQPARSIKPHASRRRAHRDTDDPDRRCATEGDHGKNTRERKNEGDACECRQQDGREAPWRQRPGYELRHRFHIKDECVLVDGRTSRAWRDTAQVDRSVRTSSAIADCGYNFQKIELVSHRHRVPCTARRRQHR